MAFGHPRWLYGALFDSAAATPPSSPPTRAGWRRAWFQPRAPIPEPGLRMHLHVHAPITCGGLDAEGRWRTGARPALLFFRPPPRRCFAASSSRGSTAHRSGASCVQRSARCAGCMANPTPRAAGAHDWVGHAKPPPGGPAQCSITLPLHAPRGALGMTACSAARWGRCAFARDNATGGSSVRSACRPTPSSTLPPRAAGRFPAPASLWAARLRPQAFRLAAARAALQTPAPQAAVISAEDFLARASGEGIRDVARTPKGRALARSRLVASGTIRPHQRRCRMGHHEHHAPPISILADAAFAPAGRGTFPDWRTRPTSHARRTVGK